MPQWLRRHRWLPLTIIATIALVAFAACGDDDDDDGGDDDGGGEKVQPTVPIKIGHLNSFTGDLSDFGPAHNNAAQLAIDEINAAGGVGGQPIELVSADTTTDPTVGSTEATRLIEVEDVDFILGALASGVTLPVAESVTGPNNILQISGASTSPALTAANDNDFLFRTPIHDTAQGAVLANLANDLGLTSVCTMYINNAYGQGLSESFAENFEDLGGTVPAQVPHESEQATYASELDTCLADSPDALAAIAYPESAGIFLRESVEAGDVDDYLFVDGTKSDTMFAELGWPDAFDTMNGTAPSSLQLETGDAFDAAYEAEFGDLPPLPFLRETYDAVYLMALAAEKSLTDDIDIREALREIANPEGTVINPGTAGFEQALEAIANGEDINYEGATGPVDLDDNGDVLIGAIETWHVDGAGEELVTDKKFRVDLNTNDVEEIQ
jgi:branched-chain amino acid transport system substrate-binding protein